MKPDENKLVFLLGANTPSGFVSRFDQIANPADGWRTYIIKGGPGCGKSTMMRKIAGEFAGDPALELIVCSSDIDSLDGVIVPGAKFSIVDGTQPHIMEPVYPGAVESLVDMTACWNEDTLHNCREEIISISRSVARCHEYCCRYLAAAGALLGDSYRLALDCVNTTKLNGYLGRLCAKELKTAPGGQGKECVRFLTALTNKGVVKQATSAKALAERIYLISDENGAVSRLMLHHVRAQALAAGHDVISCFCPLAPFDKLEQLFIPALSLGFMTSNRFHDFDLEISPYRIINCARFTDADSLKVHKKRMAYNRKAAGSMLAQAHELLAEAKALHDELEGYYIAATDFAKVDALTQRLIARMKSRV